MMKRIVLGLAALAAFQAAAITATKEYVDRSTNALAQAVAQMVPAVDLTPATNYTDSAIQGLAGQYLATTGGVVEGTAEFNFLNAGITHLDELTVSPGATSLQHLHVEGGLTVEGNLTSGAAVSGSEGYFGDAYISGVLSVNDERIDPNTLITTDNIGEYAPQPDLSEYATKSALAAVSNEAQVVYRLFSGSNVVDEVTNYHSVVRLPSRRMYQLSESNTYFKVWDEMEQHTNTLGQAKRYTDEKLAALPGEYAPRAWSRTTSGMGVEAPSNTTWISTPTTVIAGGYEPSKYITSGGAVWLITSKGAMWNFSPNVTNTAFMNIAAQDGTPMFRIEKTDSYLLGVNADEVTVTNSTLYVHLDLIGANPPYVRVCTNLQNAVWYREEDGIPAGVAVATHAQDANGWTCTIENTSGGSSLFAYFEYLQEGETKIVNQAALDVSAGILCKDGIHKVRPVYTNGVITWEVVP